MNKVIEQTTGDFITFQGWSAFNQRVKNLESNDFISEETLCSALGLDYTEYLSIVKKSIDYWRSSPSSSLFHTIGKNGLTLPEEGNTVFESHLMQTRFFMILSKLHLVSHRLLGKIKDENGEFVRIRGEFALTYPTKDSFKHEFVVRKSNEVMQMVYTYFLYCYLIGKKGLKVPSKIYRGIRYRDIWNNPVINQRIPKMDESLTYVEKRKIIIDTIQKYLLEEGLSGLCENNLVSFSASKSIAQYFSNKEGLIVEILTKDAEIMTSEVHDVRWDDSDYVTNKKEREYIVRVTGEKIQVNNVYISDLDYFVATNNPLAVNLFNHDDKQASYELNGVKIIAKYVWSSNTKGSVQYKNMNEDGWQYGSREFLKKFGISPVISNKNLKDIKNFRIDKIR